MINPANFAKLDLNLLVVFHCLMIERSVTRAAAVLHLTQGAVSSSLKRLRDEFDDELFQRTGAGMVPTRRALELAPKVSEALTTISHLISTQSGFAAEGSTRIFNIALSDDLETYLSPRLINRLNEQDLSISLSFHQTNSLLWKQSLANEHIDVAICSEPRELSAQYASQVLFSSSYSCLYDGPRLGLNSPLTKEEYLNRDHLRVSYDGRRGFVDDLFEREGAIRKVSASFTHFAGLLGALTHCDGIATLPTFAAHSLARIARLTVSPVPLLSPAFRVFMIWKIDRNNDEQNYWLRTLLIDIAREFQ